MKRFQIRPKNILFSILLFLQKRADAPICTARIEKPFSHVKVNSLNLFLHKCSTNIGFQPMRIRLSRSISLFLIVNSVDGGSQANKRTEQKD
jgi:hypothetical protein